MKHSSIIFSIICFGISANKGAIFFPRAVGTSQKLKIILERRGDRSVCYC